MSLSIDQLQEIIGRRAFSELIGQAESAVLECKKQPYPLVDDAGRLELARDVLPLANSQGGFILLGVKTTKSATAHVDELVELHPFAIELVNPIQYVDIVRQWLFPEVDGLTVRWVPVGAADAETGIVVIHVPPQKPSSRPFLSKKVVIGPKVSTIQFGYSERKGDKNVALTVEELHKYLSQGMLAERLEKRLAEMEQLMTSALGGREHEVIRQQLTTLADARIEHCLDYGTLRGLPTLVLAAVPEPSTELRTIWTTAQGSIRRLLENPPDSRENGWNMQTLDSPRIERGEALRVVNGTVKVIDLYRDGMLVFAAAADEQYLGFGRFPDGTINSVAFCESVLSFVEFYAHVLNDAQRMPERVVLRAELYSVGGEKPRRLRPYGPGFHGHLGTHEAPDHTMRKQVVVAAEEFSAGHVALALLSEIYLWFGIEPGKIPGVVGAGQMARMDKVQLLKQ